MSFRIRFAVLCLAGISLLAATGCGGRRTDAAPAPAALEAAGGFRLPGLSLVDIDSQPLRLDQWPDRVVLINVWATYCGPCEMEFPSLVALQAAHRENLQVVALALDDGPIEAVRAFAARHQANFPIVAATPEIAEALGGIDGLPTTLVFDPQGRQVERHLGFATRELLTTFITRALQSR